MANNPDRAETFHEVPASKYWYLGDTIGAVPKGFFKLVVPASFIAGVAVTLVTLYTNFWWIFAQAAFLTYWYITYPTFAAAMIYVYFRGQRQKRRRIEQAAITERRKKLDKLIGEVN